MQRRAGIQIKSEDEFQQWEAKKLQLMQILKGQHSTAIANANVDDYFIVLCVDAVRHQSRIRTLCPEFKNFSRCRIIEPVDVFDFYFSTEVDLWVATTRRLCAGDRVLDAAIKEAGSLEPDEAFFLISLVCQALGDNYAVDQERMFGLWDDWAEFAGGKAGSPDGLSGILELFEGRLFLRDNGGGEHFTVQVCHLPASLCALYFDLRVRATNNYADHVKEILALVGLRDRLEDQTEDAGSEV